MTVLLYTARHWLILTLYSCNIPYTHHLPGGSVAVDNLIGNFLLAVLHRFNMDGYLLVVVADTATHRCDALALQTTEEHLLSDAVGLQALTVYIQ